MKTIYKYELQPDLTVIDLPEDSTVLTAAAQGDRMVLWALVDPDPNVPKVARRFLTVGTGHAVPAPSIMKHVGTGLMYGGSLVWHVFEIGGGARC